MTNQQLLSLTNNASSNYLIGENLIFSSLDIQNVVNISVLLAK